MDLGDRMLAAVRETESSEEMHEKFELLYCCKCLNPERFKAIVDFLAVFNNFYLAVYIAYFLFHRYETYLVPDSEAADIFISMLPWVVNTLFCLPDISKNFTLVHGTLHCNGHAVGCVLDNGREVRGIEEEVFSAIVKKMRMEQTVKNQDLKMMFQQLDSDNSGSIDYKELWKFLESMGLFLSSHRKGMLTRVIDPDRSGQITFEEFDQRVRVRLCHYFLSLMSFVFLSIRLLTSICLFCLHSRAGCSRYWWLDC
jgi:hypothetical protein